MKISLLKSTLVCVSVALAAVLRPIDADARRLTPDEAQQRAVAAMRQSSNAKGMYKAPGVGVATSGLKLVYTSANVGADKVPAFYVFNNPASRSGEGEGFVIATADDRLRPVLGMATEGSFDATNIPSNVAWWLGEYEREIAAFLDSPAASLTAPASSPTGIVSRSTLDNYAQWEAIEPLLASKWNQSEPYNNDAPVYQGYRCVTGCVATAMAQIVRYHRLDPVQGNGVKIYSTQTLGLPVNYDFDNPVFDWDNMLDEYTYSYDANWNPQPDYSNVQATAVANLMKACGVSVEMNYTLGASGASSGDVAPALIKYFGFDESTTMKSRAKYDTPEWESMVYGELINGRPVYYDGASSEGGHAFVCDGYSEDGLFHFNWGWGGSYDGYFLLSALNPAGQGIGGFEGGYNIGQGIVLCVSPNAENKPQKPFECIFYQAADFKFNGTNVNSDNFGIGIGLGLTAPDKVTFYPAICLEDIDKKQTLFLSENKLSLSPGYLYPSLEFNVMDINVVSGVYHVYPMVGIEQVDGTVQYQQIDGGKYINELTLTVDDSGQRYYSVLDIPRPVIDVLEFKQLNEFFNEESDNALSFTLYNSGAKEFNNVIAYLLNDEIIIGQTGVIIPVGESKHIETHFSVPESITQLPAECTISLYERGEYNYSTRTYDYVKLSDEELSVTINSGRRPGNEPVASTYVEVAMDDFYHLFDKELIVPIKVISTDGSATVNIGLKLYKHGTDNISYEESYWPLNIPEECNLMIDGLLSASCEPGLYDLVAYNYNTKNDISHRVTLSFGGEANGFVYYPLLDGSGARVDAYTGSDEHIIVPNEINGIAVKEIGDEFLKSNKQVKILELPGTLTAIGTDALRFTTNLESLFIDTPEALAVGHPSTVMYGTNPGLEIYVPESAYDGYQGTILSDTYKIYKRISTLTADKAELEVAAGRKSTVTMTADVSSDYNTGCQILVSDDNIVKASYSDGIVTIQGKAEGYAVVTVISEQPGVDPVEISVTVTEAVGPVYDLNGDDQETVADVVKAVDIVVSETDVCIDFNVDGKNSVADVVWLANYLVGDKIEGVASRVTATKVMPVTIPVDGDFVALQTELSIDGADVSYIMLNPSLAATHTLVCGRQPDGTIRVLVFSLDNSRIEFAAGEPVFTLGLDGEASVAVETAFFIDRTYCEHHVTPTAIDIVAAGVADGKVEYFDLQGRHLADPRGVCIMRVRNSDGTVTTTKIIR